VKKSLFSPAKINCFLYVTGKREDGRHKLVSLMVCIDLNDEIRLELVDRETVSVVCRHPAVPEDGSNLAAMAASLFNQRWSESGKQWGVRIEIDKHIPVGAGLGGGSSNAATVLDGLNEAFGCPFSRRELMEMGESLGADVPFFLLESSALATGDGTTLEKVNVDLPPHVIVFYPGVAVSTGRVYKNVDLNLTKKRKIDIDLLLDSDWKDGQVDVLDCLGNDLENSACTVYPELESVRERLESAMPVPVHMTGSGSCFFALFSDSEQAQIAYDRFCENGKTDNDRVYLTRVVR
jgi:4-diphosphocytidyl-2-C-methyl-D-erythritol kinase